VALEETCSSQTIRRALLEFAMRFAPTDELDGQLHCWQASDAGAAGRPDVWSLPEPGELEEGYVHGAEAPLLEYLSQERIDAYAHGAMLDTEVLLLGCLLALGAPRQAAWARQLQERRGELDPGALRLGHVVGIVAAAITVSAKPSFPC